MPRSIQPNPLPCPCPLLSPPRSPPAQAIDAFQNDPPTTVFLLSMRSGSVGINLTAASHVFLMEPALNPALEVRCTLCCAVLRCALLCCVMQPACCCVAPCNQLAALRLLEAAGFLLLRTMPMAGLLVFLRRPRSGTQGTEVMGFSAAHALYLFLCCLQDQAIGRSWRMGQKREVKVKRFYVKVRPPPPCRLPAPDSIHP